MLLQVPAALHPPILHPICCCGPPSFSYCDWCRERQSSLLQCSFMESCQVTRQLARRGGIQARGSKLVIIQECIENIVIFDKRETVCLISLKMSSERYKVYSTGRRPQAVYFSSKISALDHPQPNTGPANIQMPCCFQMCGEYICAQDDVSRSRAERRASHSRPIHLQGVRNVFTALEVLREIYSCVDDD